MPRAVELWIHPDTLRFLQSLLPREETRSLVTRSMAVFDTLAAHCGSPETAAIAVAEVSPLPLSRVEYLGANLRQWPATADGRHIAAECQEVLLCLYQVRRLRSSVAILVGESEWYVVWLSAELTAEPRSDGFIDDADAALGEQRLVRDLKLLFDLTWLETA